MNHGATSPPPHGDENLGPAVLAVFWVQVVVCMFVLALRLWARRSIGNIGWDDWLMLSSQGLFFLAAGLATVQNAVGGYRHTYYLKEMDIITALKINFILRAVVIVAYIPSKAAVGVLILRVTERRNIWQRKVVWITIIFTALLNALNTIFNFVQCNPVNANWDLAVKATANCWPAAAQLDFAYFQCAENIVADAVLALIPITFLVKLRITMRKKVSACILMGLGLMATVCGSIKTYELSSIGSSADFTWSEYGLTVWSASELFVIIVCGSIPALVPLCNRYFETGPLGYGRGNKAIRLEEQPHADSSPCKKGFSQRKDHNCRS